LKVSSNFDVLKRKTIKGRTKWFVGCTTYW